MTKEKFEFVIKGVVDGFEYPMESHKFLDHWMRGEKFKDIHSIHVFKEGELKID